VFKAKTKISKQLGFALVTELVSLFVFGFGVFALSNLSGKTATANSEALQRVHATWLANSLLSRIVMNSNEARQLSYSMENINCDLQTYATRTDADLAALFCNESADVNSLQTKPIEMMGDIRWSIICNQDNDEADDIKCSLGSEFTIRITWQNLNSSLDQQTEALAYSFTF